MAVDVGGSDLDILGRLRNVVLILRHWKPGDAPLEPLAEYWVDARRLCDEAMSRLKGNKHRSMLMRQFVRRLDGVAVTPYIINNQPLPQFDEVRICEPLNTIIDDIILDASDPATRSVAEPDPDDASTLPGVKRDEFENDATSPIVKQPTAMSDASTFDDWLTITEAALAIDVDKAEVSRNCGDGTKGTIRSQGTGRQRRVDANSLFQYKAKKDRARE